MKLQELKNIIKNEIRLALAEGDTETKPAPVKPATPTKQPNHPLRPKKPKHYTCSKRKNKGTNTSKRRYV